MEELTMKYKSEGRSNERVLWFLPFPGRGWKCKVILNIDTVQMCDVFSRITTNFYLQDKKIK